MFSRLFATSGMPAQRHDVYRKEVCRTCNLAGAHPCTSPSSVHGWRGSCITPKAENVTFTYNAPNLHSAYSPLQQYLPSYSASEFSTRRPQLSHDSDVDMPPKGGAKGGKAAGKKPAEEEKKGGKVKGAQQIDVRHILVSLLLLSH